MPPHNSMESLINLFGLLQKRKRGKARSLKKEKEKKRGKADLLSALAGASSQSTKVLWVQSPVRTHIRINQ